MRSIASWAAEERKITSKSRIYWANLRRKVALFTTWWWWCTRSWCTPLAHVATLECWNAHWSIGSLWVYKNSLMWVPMAPNNLALCVSGGMGFSLFTTWWCCTRSWCIRLAHMATLEWWNAHYTEVCFASFLSSGFITAIVENWQYAPLCTGLKSRRI